ncbi:conjugal transfer protein TraD [Asaia bogorensis]|uniref:conjugal transfer protein TraD n=1 Tax=Asaia bogorensis TaxID=91915 RepID=UPI000EFA4D69|nr:conjugal transfer protein TraD [Asaia bogorensis]
MRKPRDIDAELVALQKRAKALKAQRTMQLGELVEALGADALPVEALAGVLLSALEQAEDKPEAIARWSERGQAFFQARPKRRASRASQQAADGAPDA